MKVEEHSKRLKNFANEVDKKYAIEIDTEKN